MVVKILKKIFVEATELQFRRQIPTDKIVIVISKDLENRINDMNEMISYYTKDNNRMEQKLFGCHLVVDEKAKRTYYAVSVMSEV